jgi:hypothetical protein
MTRYTVGQFESGGLMVVGSVRPDDPRLGDLMTASFDFRRACKPWLFAILWLPAQRRRFWRLSYSEPSDDLEQMGPGQFEPLGAVEFNFGTGTTRAYVLRDEPLLKAMIDGKRRSWREKHVQRRQR